MRPIVRAGLLAVMCIAAIASDRLRAQPTGSTPPAAPPLATDSVDQADAVKVFLDGQSRYCDRGLLRRRDSVRQLDA
jgi:hypothetical protein